MRVDFDLSLLSQGILVEFRRAMTAMQGAIPVLASKVQEWLTDELERRQKAAKGEAVKPVAMLVPLLDERELSRGMKTLTAVTCKLETVELETALEDKDLKLAREYKLAAAFSCAILPARRAPGPRVGALGAARPVGCPPAQRRRISAETGKTGIAQERRSGERR